MTKKQWDSKFHKIKFGTGPKLFGSGSENLQDCFTFSFSGSIVTEASELALAVAPELLLVLSLVELVWMVGLLPDPPCRL